MNCTTEVNAFQASRIVAFPLRFKETRNLAEVYEIVRNLIVRNSKNKNRGLRLLIALEEADKACSGK